MSDQPRSEYLDPSDFFADGASARHPVEGTIARDLLPPDSPQRTGKDAAGRLLDDLPGALTAEVLARGQTQFSIHCAICHGDAGYGNGIVVERGFPAPLSYHTPRLRDAPLGYFVHVIAEGYGVMYPYASRVPPDDRWAIAAYIRTLQLSQHADAANLPERDRAILEEVER